MLYSKAENMQKRRDLYKKLGEKHKKFIEDYLANSLKLPKEKWEEFLFPEYDKHLHDFSEMKDMKKAVERFISALEKNEKICIYGDYDCDGVPGVALFRDFLEKINYKNVIYYIPHRHKEGYGMHMAAIEKFAKEKVKLIVTIDLGITNIKEIDFANEKNIDVIVTDHHLPIEDENGQILPKAFAIINNKQNGCEYKFKELCGSSTVWKFICGIIKELQSEPLQSLSRQLPKGKHTYTDLIKEKKFKYNPKLIEKAKENRKKFTKAESYFWNLVKSKNLNYNFTKQKVIENFVIDFFCKELLLGIEIDGEYHENQMEYDKERTKVIEEYKIKIIRFKNNEIENLNIFNLEDILKNREEELYPSHREGGQRPEGVVGDLKSIPVGYEKWLLDMVGVATISDLVPLHGENRVLAIYGIHVLSQTKRQGLKKIFTKNNVDILKINETDIAFTLAPRINAASRMAHPEVALRMLSTNLEESLAGAEELENLNKNRKESVASIMKKVHAKMEERILQSKLPEIVVIGDRDWGAGVLGLIASQIVDKYNVNAFVYGGDDETHFKGSCRSNGTAHVVKLMTDATSLFTHFGGHEMSGGFAINFENIFILEKTLNEIFAKDKKAHIEKKEEVKENILKIFLEEIDSKMLDTLSLLGPFGMGNAMPTFQIENITDIKTERFGKNKEHLKLVLSGGVERKVFREAIKFFCDQELENKISNTKWEEFKFQIEAGFRSNIPRLKLVI